MKRFIALTVVLTAVIGLTLSFAGPERYEAKNVAPPMPACDWSGFYIGVHGGVGSYESKITDARGFNLDNTDGNIVTTSNTDINGLFGGQIGFNWQKGAMVLGLEADGAWTNFSTSDNVNRSVVFDYYRQNSQIDFMGTVRGRMGLAYENVLVYVTGGVAFASGNRSAHYNEDEENIETSEYANWKADDFRVGIVGGVGVEYMANCHWTIRAETLFAVFQKDTVDDSVGQDAVGFPYRFQDQVFMVRLGLNYKFGSFGH